MTPWIEGFAAPSLGSDAFLTSKVSRQEVQESRIHHFNGL